MTLPNISSHVKKSGFTLIETLVVIAIFIILVVMGLFVGIDSYRNSNLRTERDRVVTILQKTRSLALNNINETAHGVRFEASRYVIFHNSVYNPSQPDNEIINTNPGISLNGLSEVIFQPLTGETSVDGDIILNNRSLQLTVSLNNEGRINW